MNGRKKNRCLALILAVAVMVVPTPFDRCRQAIAAEDVTEENSGTDDTDLQEQSAETDSQDSVQEEDTTQELTSENDTASESADPLALEEKTVTLTKGFSETFTALNAVGTVTWKSDNTAVAAVSSKGKVTAKKKGKAVITATDERGVSASCQVKVEPNAYSRLKYTVSQTEYGNAYLSVYKISYDKSGNLVIKAQLLNNSGRKVTKLKSVKIKVKNAEGKVIGTFKESKEEVRVKQGKAKNLTFTIKKKDLKKSKVQNLRLIENTGITVSFSYEQNI